MAWLSSSSSNAGLIENMLSASLISSSAVANAMRRVDRIHYVVTKEAAYQDAPQPIGYGATISAPHMHAHAAENLLHFCSQVDSPRILDVGSGSGYTAAIFYHLAKAKGGRVVGIDHIKELVDASVRNLRDDGLGWELDGGIIKMIAGDGRQGYLPGAPYTAIHVGAAAPTMPQALIEQLAKPGRMFVPVEDGDTEGQNIWQVDKDEHGQVSKHRLFGVRYVPLTDKDQQWSTAA